MKSSNRSAPFPAASGPRIAPAADAWPVSRRRLLVLGGLAGLSLAGYLLASAVTYRIGFPLDDAWIHQTYARNLALRGEWSFVAGQPSAGSTAPLWSALLAVGHVLHLGPYVWSYLLGWAALLGTALAGMAAFRRLRPERSRLAVWVGVFLVLEWRLVWAASSGMETLLSALLALAVGGSILSPNKNWFAIGALVGLSVWVRPDGLTLAGPALWSLLFDPRPLRARLPAATRLMGGFLVLFLPYLGFNRLLAGAWWPNTYFAKQAEYAVLLAQPLWRRLLTELSLPLIGAGVLLLPGFVLQVAGSLRRRAWLELAGPLWLVGYLLVYALRLPVTYQHGRYAIPAMPVYFVWSLAGMLGWLDLLAAQPVRRVASRAWLMAVALLTLAFWGVGANAYAEDVAVIESEMVAAAHWVDANTPPDARIAAHDIGALGYFAGRNLLDLAGLVSPEVVPFIRDEAALAAYLDERAADYLVTFPAWYPQLSARSRPLYTTGGTFSPAMGGENMSVYRWSP